ncbi:hypothetical protein NIES4071_83380 [Calothrix sp. NIES-4071]|nr:hypothetical protein NIES4071_83380 [Calothrix sp. NIES-4071]BAZ62606.1 hypothetical protein NIES4105_83310 [Calothrix sp. NIES-4105]
MDVTKTIDAQVTLPIDLYDLYLAPRIFSNLIILSNCKFSLRSYPHRVVNHYASSKSPLEEDSKNFVIFVTQYHFLCSFYLEVQDK